MRYLPGAGAGGVGWTRSGGGLTRCAGAKMPSSVAITDMPACAPTAVSAMLSRGDGRRGKHTTEEAKQDPQCVER